MKKLIAAISLAVLAYSFLFLGVTTPAAAAEEDILPAAASAEAARETVYPTTDVNVRTGPGTKHGIIGVLAYGTSAQRTEIGSDGWSKVIFEGSEGYVRSKYLTTEKPDAPRAESSSASADGSVVFEAVDQTVYANTTVNVRSGPGSKYESIGRCSAEKSLRRIGIGANGWSKVIYKGETGYVSTKYLSDSKREAQAASGSGLSGDQYGRLTIPSVGIDVGLYYCASGSDAASAQAQRIVDAEDSAAYLDQAFVEGVIIADHNHHGFSAIRSCSPKKTRAYIDFGTHTQEYLCTAVGNGRNTGNDLRDWNNNSLNYGSIPGGLAMYTCNENWNDVTITYWKPVAKRSSED